MVEIVKLTDEYVPAMLEFIGRQEPNHPELSEGKIQKWVKRDDFIALHEGKIVGCIGSLPQVLSTPKGRITVGWGNNVIVDMSDDAIRKQAGRGLLTAAENNLPYFGVGIISGIIGPYKRRGMILNDEWSKMYSYFKKPEVTLKYLGKNPLLGIPIRFMNMFHKGGTEFKDLEMIDSFKPEWDPIWEKHLSRYEMYGVRDAEYLNYKLQQPDRDYQIYISRDKSGEPDGYMIIRVASHRVKNLTLLKVCDLVGTNESRFKLLSTAMYKGLHEYDVDGIVAISSSDDADLFRSCGMYIKKNYLIGVQPGYEYKMHLTLFDSDLDHLW